MPLFLFIGLLYFAFLCFYFFFFNDTATTEIYTLSLHDALPIYCRDLAGQEDAGADAVDAFLHVDRMAHRDDTVLGGGVERAGEAADEAAGHRGGVDDQPVPPRPHDRQGHRHALRRGRQVAVDHQLGVFRGQLVPMPVVDVDPGIVEEDVQPADLILDEFADAAHRGGVGEVAGLDMGGTAGGLDP